MIFSSRGDEKLVSLTFYSNFNLKKRKEKKSCPNRKRAGEWGDGDGLGWAGLANFMNAFRLGSISQLCSLYMNPQSSIQTGCLHTVSLPPTEGLSGRSDSLTFVSAPPAPITIHTEQRLFQPRVERCRSRSPDI